MKTITILGATGSIGVSTLDVVARHPDRYRVFALTAQRRIDELAALCHRFVPRYAVVPDDAAARRLRARLRESVTQAGAGMVADAAGVAQANAATEVLAGEAALEQVAAADGVDMVMAAIVGAAGLRPTLAAARRGKQVLLANKEALVMAGRLFTDVCQHSGAALLPIDSEHNAIFQCLTPTPTGRGLPQVPAGVRRVLLTASGGPFRDRSLAEMRRMSPDQACAHPNWSMGRKISVDSATMMNKGLELIEAHFLFGLPSSRLDVVVHPQSIIHSLVEYTDGSLLAQLGNPDMRTPIAHAMAFPERIESGVSLLDLAAIGRLDFQPPDPLRFPCLRLARETLDAGGGAPCVLNAANEVSVEAFLGGTLAFTDIADVNDRVMQSFGPVAAPTDLEAAVALDAQARSVARRHLQRCAA